MTFPRLYFRVKENGAAVFRIAHASREGRLDMEPIATVALRSGQIRETGDLSDDDRARIEAWLADRRDVIEARRGALGADTAEAVMLCAHWVQSEASDEALDAVTDDLLLAMHDLRAALARRRAGREG